MSPGLLKKTIFRIPVKKAIGEDFSYPLLRWLKQWFLSHSKRNLVYMGGAVFLLLISLPTLPLPSSASGPIPPDLTDLSLEELMEIEVDSVSAASKYEQKVTKAPSAVTIITADQIKKYGYRTLADILRSVRGFSFSYDRNYSYLGVRGFNRPGDYNTRVLLLIDGHRLNDNIYDSAFVGTEFPLDIDLISRVEVIPGPSSSIYGTNAFFGVVNIVTQRGRDLKGQEISSNVGSFNALQGRLTFGNQFQNGLEAIVSGSGYGSQGHHHLYFKEFDSPLTNYGTAENCDYDRSYSVFGTLAYNDFTLQGLYGDRKKGIPTGSYGVDFNDPFNRTFDARGYLDLKYAHRFENELDVVARVYYDHYRYDGDYVYGGVINKDSAQGDWLGTELRFTKTLFQKHKLILGGEYNYNINQSQKNYDDNPYQLYLDDERSITNWALYLQDEFRVLKNLTFYAGLRYDRFDTFGGEANPRLALVYNPLEKTFLKLVYGSAFRAPNTYEFYYQTTAGATKANPDLKPEKIHTYELILEQYMGTHLRGAASLFYNKVKDLISQVIDPTDHALVFRNVDKIETRGLGLELDGKWPGLLEGRISYSFHEAKNKDTGEILTNSPKHLVKLNLIVPFPFLKENLFLGVEEQYTGKRKTLAGREAEAFFMTNLSIFSQHLIKGLEVSASIYNLFNKKYDDPGASEHVQDTIRQDGRTYRLKLTYRF